MPHPVPSHFHHTHPLAPTPELEDLVATVARQQNRSHKLHEHSGNIVAAVGPFFVWPMYPMYAHVERQYNLRWQLGALGALGLGV